MDHNIVVSSSQWKGEDIPILFGEEDVVFTNTEELSALCKELGVYQSTSAARRAGRVGDIPKGWSEVKASRKHFLFIWNPDE